MVVVAFLFGSRCFWDRTADASALVCLAAGDLEVKAGFGTLSRLSGFLFLSDFCALVAFAGACKSTKSRQFVRGHMHAHANQVFSFSDCSRKRRA